MHERQRFSRIPVCAVSAIMTMQWNDLAGNLDFLNLLIWPKLPKYSTTNFIKFSFTKKPHKTNYLHKLFHAKPKYIYRTDYQVLRLFRTQIFQTNRLNSFFPTKTTLTIYLERFVIQASWPAAWELIIWKEEVRYWAAVADYPLWRTIERTNSGQWGPDKILNYRPG